MSRQNDGRVVRSRIDNRRSNDGEWAMNTCEETGPSAQDKNERLGGRTKKSREAAWPSDNDPNRKYASPKKQAGEVVRTK